MRELAMLPCSQILFKARAINLGRLKEVWNKNTIYVMRNCDTEKLTFFCSSGRLWESYQGQYAVGKQHRAKHDQTGKNLGVFRIENIIDVENDQIVNKENDIGCADRAPIWVFK